MESVLINNNGASNGSPCKDDAFVKAVAAAVNSALGKECAMTVDQVEGSLAVWMKTHKTKTYSKQKMLSASVMRPRLLNWIIPMSNPGVFTELKRAYVIENWANFIFAGVHLPSRKDVQAQTLAVQNTAASAGKYGESTTNLVLDFGGSPSLNTAFFGGVAYYVYKVSWTAGDIGYNLRISEKSNGTQVMKITPADDDCYEAWFLVPASAKVFSSMHEGSTVYTQVINGASESLVFTVFNGNAAHSGTGGFTVEKMAVPLTRELFTSVIPSYDVSQRRFNREKTPNQLF